MKQHKQKHIHPSNQIIIFTRNVVMYGCIFLHILVDLTKVASSLVCAKVWTTLCIFTSTRINKLPKKQEFYR